MGRADNLLSLGFARSMKLKQRYNTSTNLFSVLTGSPVRSVVLFRLVSVFLFLVILHYWWCFIFLLLVRGSFLLVIFCYYWNLNSSLQPYSTKTSNDWWLAPITILLKHNTRQMLFFPEIKGCNLCCFLLIICCYSSWEHYYVCVGLFVHSLASSAQRRRRKVYVLVGVITILNWRYALSKI